MPISPIYYACFLKKFNNYFNRIIKGYETLAEYQSAAADYFLYDKPINYNPYDNVSTELIMNDCDFDPDYVLILNSELSIVARWFVLESVFTREKQRKFTLRRDVIYDNKEALKQSPIFIQKAMLEETDPFILNSEGMSFNEIKTSETLLKDKTGCAWIIGYVAKSLGAKKISAQAGEGTIVDYVDFADIATAIGMSAADLAAVCNFDGSATNKTLFLNKNLITYGTGPAAGSNVPFTNRRVHVVMSGDFSSFLSSQNPTVLSWEKIVYATVNPAVELQFENNLWNAFITNKASLVSSLNNDVFNRLILTEAQKNILISYEGKTVKYNDVFYKFHFASEKEITLSSGYHVYNYYTAFGNCFTAAASGLSGTLVSNGEIQIQSKGTEAALQLQQFSPDTKIPAAEMNISSSRIKVEEQAFDMFAIPYGDLTIRYGSNTPDRFTTDLYVIKKIIGQSLIDLDTNLYDIQLLPYCPRQDIPVNSNHELDIRNLTENKDFDYIVVKDIPVSGSIDDRDYTTHYTGAAAPVGYKNVEFNGILDDVLASQIQSLTYTVIAGESLISDASLTTNQVGQSLELLFNFNMPSANDKDEVKIIIHYVYLDDKRAGVILWNDSASFSLSLDYQLTMTEGAKIESQCNKYRLCSPNYQGSFDFNLARNGGKVNYFLAECTYKPYTPYIKVAPEFSYLYGVNFGDARGLICGGDYSIPRFSSAWENYQLNNKNYQNIFNREIQNLDFEQSLAMRYQLIGGSVEILNAGAKGAGTGAFLGGGWGALAGGIAGTALSAAGMAADVDLLGKKQREQKSLAIDKFNYQLGNIKALPYTLTKVGAFDINSKIFPFLEYYTCTPEEKEALQSKIQYESMTVMRIGLVGTYFGAFSEPRYFKGELIRNEVIAEDNHIFEALYAELLKGVYF